MGYLLNEAIFAVLMFVLNIALWIPGHSKTSIVNLLNQDKQASNAQQPFIEKEENDEDKLKRIRKKSKDSRKLKFAAEEKQQVTRQSLSSKNTTDKNEDFFLDKLNEQKNAERELSILNHDANEIKKKSQSLWQQIQQIFSRQILVLIIIVYSLAVGTVTANGPLNGEMIVRYGRSEVKIPFFYFKIFNSFNKLLEHRCYI